MKTKYEVPEMSIVFFEIEDYIADMSGPGPGGFNYEDFF